MFFFPIIAQPVPPHPAEPGRASHWIRRFLGRTPTEPAKPFKLLNQVLGSSPSLPLEISRDGFYHKPVRVCSPLVIPRLYLESVHPKACREDLQESSKEGFPGALKANAFKGLPQSLWVPTSTSALQFLKPRGPSRLTLPPPLASELLDI